MERERASHWFALLVYCLRIFVCAQGFIHVWGIGVSSGWDCSQPRAHGDFGSAIPLWLLQQLSLWFGTPVLRDSAHFWPAPLINVGALSALGRSSALALVLILHGFRALAGLGVFGIWNIWCLNAGQALYLDDPVQNLYLSGSTAPEHFKMLWGLSRAGARHNIEAGRMCYLIFGGPHCAYIYVYIYI